MRKLPLKAVVVSTSVVSMAMMLKLSLPLILDFLTSQLPLFWSLALSWLTPPYLYLLINCIIITIVASSKLHPIGQGDGDFVIPPLPEKLSTVEREAAPVVDAMKEEEDDVVVFGYVESPVVVVKADPVVAPPLMDHEINVGGVDDDEKENVRYESYDVNDEFVLSKPVWNSPTVVDSPVNSAEKPPYSSRFGHRRTAKATPEGKTALRVSRPKKQETLGSTWRTITEGRSMPLTRHLKKSETFAGVSPEASPVKVMKKSETFDGGNSSPASGNGRLRREPSLSNDELNRRVEAFIKKFNEEMRLQRQDSLNQYKEMITQ